MVLKESVDNRLIEQPGPGRPKYDEDEVIDMSPAEYTKFVQDFYDARMRELAAEEDNSVVKKSKTPRKKNQSFRQAPVDAVKQELESPQVSLA